jgi:transcriptional regulator with XRE-family HTH domain
MRAFARDSGVSYSTIWKLLNSNILSADPRTLEKIGTNLKLPKKKLHFFVGKALKEILPDFEPVLRSYSISKVRYHTKNISAADFEKFNQWGIWVLISRLDTGSISQNELELLAKETRLEKKSIDEFVEWLLARGLVELDQKGHLRKRRSIRLFAESKVDNASFKALHRRSLSAAARATRTQNASERYNATEFFTLAPKTFPRAVELTNNYLDELQSLSNQSTPDKKNYALSLGLFRTFPRKEKK